MNNPTTQSSFQKKNSIQFRGEVNNEYEALLIDQYDQETLEVPKQQQNRMDRSDPVAKLEILQDMNLKNFGDSYQIYDKQSKIYRNIKIPLVTPQHDASEEKNKRTLKKHIMQTIMDYKVEHKIGGDFIDILTRTSLPDRTMLHAEE